MFEAEKLTKASSGCRVGFRRAVVASSLVSVAALASAASVTYTQSPVFSAVDSSSSTQVLAPQFNPALGQLNSVVITYSDSAFSASEVVNLSTKNEKFVARWSKASIGASVTSGSITDSDSVTALTFFGTNAAGTLFPNGTLVGGGSDLGSDSESSTPTHTYTAPADLAQFEGLGNVLVSDNFAADGFTASGGPQFGFIVNFGSAGSTITYNYTPVPAPAAAGTMLIGLVGAIARRRKS